MTRFIMSLNQAVQLVIELVALAQPGDVLVTKMPAIRISDLAEVMVREFAPRCGRDPASIEIVVRGQRTGEKLYEELMNEEETRRSFELAALFCRPPRNEQNRRTRQRRRTWMSSRCRSNALIIPRTSLRCRNLHLAAFLHTNGLLNERLDRVEEID